MTSKRVQFLPGVLGQMLWPSKPLIAQSEASNSLVQTCLAPELRIYAGALLAQCRVITGRARPRGPRMAVSMPISDVEAIEVISVESGRDPNQVIDATAIDESKRYMELVPARSAYDNHMLSFIRTDKVRSKWRPWWMLIANFITQYVVVYLLWQKLKAARSETDAELFGHSGILKAASQGLCFKHGESMKGSGQGSLSCAQDEVFLFQDFHFLDLNGDGVWTFQEAKELDAQYIADTGRHVNMADVYQNVLTQIRSHAYRSVMPCGLNDTVEAFMDNWGIWTEVQIYAISSSDQVSVIATPNSGWAGANWSHPRGSLRRVVEGQPFDCSVPKCTNTDAGATSQKYLGCDDFATYRLACTEADVDIIDDEDFSVRTMCCVCGGGSTSVSLAGISHLPVNLSMQSVSHLEQYTTCLQKFSHTNSQEVCIQNFTFLPEWVFQRELVAFANLCMLPDHGLCANLASKDMLPPLDFAVEHALPMFLKMTGFKTLAELRPQEICKRTVETVCPAIFAVESSLFQERRNDICGVPTGQVEDEKRTLAYESSTQYNGSAFGLTSWGFDTELSGVCFIVHLKSWALMLNGDSLPSRVSSRA